MRSALNDRGISAGRYSNDFSLEPPQAKVEVSEETIICHSKPASFSSTDSSDGGLSRRVENLMDVDHLNSDQSSMPYSRNPDEYCSERRASVSGELSLLDNKLGVTVADSHVPDIKLPKIPSCQNQYLGLRSYTGGTNHTYGDGNTLTKVHDSDGIGVTKAPSNPTTKNKGSGNVNLNQEEQEIVGSLCDFSCEPTGMKEAISSSISNELYQNEYNDMVGREDDATRIVAVSCTNFSFRKEKNNREEDNDMAEEDMIGLFEEGRETLEQAGAKEQLGL